MAKQFEKYIFPATGSSKKKYLDANNNQETNIGEYLTLGAGGNVFGTALGLGANAIQQNMQLANQKELMNQQNIINRNNAAQAAQIQVHGQQNAGLNPAMAEGGIASAPQVSQGAANMGSMGLANVFDGIANIIAAAKAPSEIAQTQATTTKTGAETENITADTSKKKAETKNITYDYTTMKPEQVKKMEKDIEKLNEDIQNTRNVNEIYQTKSDFIRTYAPSIFTGWRDQLKSNNNWNKLPEKTRETIDSLANGDIEMDIGSIEGLNQIIKTQSDLSEADKNIMQNLVNTSVALKQLKNNNILDKIAKMPTAQYNKLQNEMKFIDEKTTNQQIKNWSDIVNDKNFMVTKSLWNELLKVEGLEQAEKTMDNIHELIKSFRPRGKIKGKTTTTKTGKNHKGSYSETTVTDYGL